MCTTGPRNRPHPGRLEGISASTRRMSSRVTPVRVSPSPGAEPVRSTSSRSDGGELVAARSDARADSRHERRPTGSIRAAAAAFRRRRRRARASRRGPPRAPLPGEPIAIGTQSATRIATHVVSSAASTASPSGGPTLPNVARSRSLVGDSTTRRRAPAESRDREARRYFSAAAALIRTFDHGTLRSPWMPARRKVRRPAFSGHEPPARPSGQPATAGLLEERRDVELVVAEVRAPRRRAGRRCPRGPGPSEHDAPAVCRPTRLGPEVALPGLPSSQRSKPAAITVTRTSSPISSSMTVPKMMFASGCATAWMISIASFTSNSPSSGPAGDVDENAARALDRVLEQRRRDRPTSGVHRPTVSGRVPDPHDRRARSCRAPSARRRSRC